MYLPFHVEVLSSNGKKHLKKIEKGAYAPRSILNYSFFNDYSDYLKAVEYYEIVDVIRAELFRGDLYVDFDREMLFLREETDLYINLSRIILDLRKEISNLEFSIEELKRRVESI